MVRKMVKKKRAKKKVKQTSIGKEDFETFGFGVQRLKELKKELDGMDTRGFSKEEQSIRSKLKKVSEIPAIEREIKALKAKINNKYKPKKKRKSKILKEIKELKQDTGKISALRGEIKDLKEQVEDKKKKPIDSGVDILIDSNFNDFLKETKASLSDRIRSREKEINDILKSDLMKRESKFKEKHDNLIQDFNNKKRELEKQLETKYNLKVKRALAKEIAEKFNAAVKKEINLEKVRLGKRYTAELREHANAKLARDEQKLHQRAQEELAKKMGKVDSQMQELQQDKQDLAYQKELEKKLIGEKLEDQSKELEKKKQKELLRLQREKQKEFNALANKRKGLQQDRQNFVLKKASERKMMKEKLVSEFHKELNKELKKKEKAIRKQLNNEFDLKLKRQIQDHENELKEKKINLELEFQTRMKEVFRGS